MKLTNVQMSGSTVAALAGGVTAAAYLNAKFHVQKDLRTLITMARAMRKATAAGMLELYIW